MGASRQRKVRSRRGQAWSGAELAQLGKRPDSVLACANRRTIKEVVAMREHLRIALATGPRHQQVLGTRPDDQVALLLGTTAKIVRHRRYKLHIPPCAAQAEAQRQRVLEALTTVRGNKPVKYTPEEDKLLGTMSDADLARLLGRPRVGVEARRIKFKIPKFDPKLHLWTPQEDALLGTMTDKELAARLGVSWTAVAHRRRRLCKPVRFAHRRPWTPEEDVLLGTASDSEIAARLGRFVSTVCIRRQKLGIPNAYWQQRCGRQRRLKKT